MEKGKLDEILKKHAAWLNYKDGGERAYLSGAYLSGAYLSDADLSYANLIRAWVAKIRTTYPDEKNVYRREYEAAIAFFKAVAEANEENAQNG